MTQQVVTSHILSYLCNNNKLWSIDSSPLTIKCPVYSVVLWVVLFHSWLNDNKLWTLTRLASANHTLRIVSFIIFFPGWHFERRFISCGLKSFLFKIVHIKPHVILLVEANPTAILGYCSLNHCKVNHWFWFILSKHFQYVFWRFPHFIIRIWGPTVEWSQNRITVQPVSQTCYLIHGGYQWRIQGGAPGMRPPPPRPNFSKFHAVLGGKFVSWHPQPEGWCTLCENPGSATGYHSRNFVWNHDLW